MIKSSDLSNSSGSSTLLLYLPYSLLSIISMITIGNDVGPKGASWLIFSQHFIISSAVIIYNAKYFVQILSPSSLALIYLGISFSVGSYLAPSDYAYDFRSFNINIKDYSIINTYLLCCLTSITCASLRSINYLQRHLTESDTPHQNTRRFAQVYAPLILLVLTVPLKHDLLFGIRFGLTVLSLYYCARLSSKKAYVTVSSVIIAVFIVCSYENKREILLVAFVTLFIFSSYNMNKMNLSVSNIALAITVPLAVFLLIVIASISRGYGGYDHISPINSALFALDYIRSDQFIYMFSENIEATHTYPASVFSIQLVNQGLISMQGGSTLLKPIFLPIPREIFPYKPESSIAIFTSTLSAARAASGVSLPVPIPSEMFMNFSYLGIPLIYMLFTILERFFRLAVGYISHQRLLLKSFIFINISMLSMIATRGGGFDIFVLSCLLAIMPYVALKLLSLAIRSL